MSAWTGVILLVDRYKGSSKASSVFYHSRDEFTVYIPVLRNCGKPLVQWIHWRNHQRVDEYGESTGVADGHCHLAGNFCAGMEPMPFSFQERYFFQDIAREA